VDIRSLQKPLKDRYRNDPSASKITIRARGGQTATPMSCLVDLGCALYEAEALRGVGGAGTGACSGDLLLDALQTLPHPPALRTKWSHAGSDALP
jgi:hypothetical protein